MYQVFGGLSVPAFEGFNLIFGRSVPDFWNCLYLVLGEVLGNCLYLVFMEWSVPALGFFFYFGEHLDPCFKGRDITDSCVNEEQILQNLGDFFEPRGDL